MTQKIVISKSGYNALTESDTDNLTYSSDYDTLKYYASGDVTVNTNYANYYAVEGSMFGNIYYHRTVVTVTHSLGYVPFFRGFVTVSGDDTLRCTAPFYVADFVFWDFEMVYADSTKLYFVVEYRNFDNSGTVSRTFSYRIFRNRTGI